MPVSVSTGPPLELVREELEKAIADLQYKMSEGMAKSFDEYRYQVGYLRGLRVALEALRPKDVLLKVTEVYDDHKREWMT